jgi:hypothetical protein
LGGAVDRNILSVGLAEEGSCFLDSAALLNEGVLAVDFLNLFGLQVLLGLKLCDFSEFFVDVADLLLERTQEGLILLVYDGLRGFLHLDFLGHPINY